MNLMNINLLGVHNGVFHADDVLCGAMVRLCNPEVKIIRTRDEKLLSTCDLVADVGMGKYDHHQKDARIRKNGIKYCGASLIWEEFGEEIIDAVLQNKCTEEAYDSILSETIVRTKTKIDETILISVDASDNGQKLLRDFTPEEVETIHFTTLSGIISSYNLPEADFNDTVNYEAAVNFATKFLEEVILMYVSSTFVYSLSEPVFRYLEGLDTILDDMFRLACNPALGDMSISNMTSKEIIEMFPHNLLTYFTGDNKITSEMADKLIPKMVEKLTGNANMEKVYELINLINPNITLPTADFVYKIMGPTTLPFYKEYITNTLKQLVYVCNCEKDVEAAYNTAISENKEYMILDKSMPWKEKLLELDPTHQIKFVIYGVNNGAEYRGQGVPISMTDQTCVLYYPEAWRTKRVEELSEASGVPDSVFCHASGFLCGNKTLQGILAMTEKALLQKSSVQSF